MVQGFDGSFFLDPFGTIQNRLLEKDTRAFWGQAGPPG